MIGGVLEYSALLIGYRALLLVTAALYACAFLGGALQLPGHARAPRAS